ncbi:malate-aspartate shuttle [Aureococcus anophagefferens]|uniref:Malate-aspartate shuttle n=1 Tax=Aureococcus anophagefferens TaxID=44056 RepID=A0ABR1FS62_AURAN
MSTSSSRVSFFPKLATGGVAGMLGVTAVFPVDLCKTRMQNGGAGSVQANTRFLDVFRGVLRTEGFRGFYRGLVPNLVGVFPEKGIKLAANDLFRHFAARGGLQRRPALPIATQVACGAGAAALQVTLGGGAAGSVVRQILRDDGPRGFFRGVGPRVAIFSGLYGMMFLSYECANAVLGI